MSDTGGRTSSSRSARQGLRLSAPTVRHILCDSAKRGFLMLPRRCGALFARVVRCIGAPWACPSGYARRASAARRDLETLHRARCPRSPGRDRTRVRPLLAPHSTPVASSNRCHSAFEACGQMPPASLPPNSRRTATISAGDCSSCRLPAPRT